MVLIGLFVLGLGALFLYAAITNHSVPCLLQNAIGGGTANCLMS